MIEYLLKHQHTAKDRIIQTMGGCCQICGYNKCVQALDLHHINPEEKDRVISGNLLNNAWTKVCNELKKCILVCANCHREIHAGLHNEKLVSSYNNEIADQFAQMIEKFKTKQNHYCKNCGAVIYRGSTYCIKCSQTIRRVCERPNREELKQLIRATSFTTIASKYNVTDNTIRKWCKSYNLPYRVSDIMDYSDEEWLLI